MKDVALPLDALPVPAAVTGDGDCFELALRLELSLAWFEGHFPGRPVFPGVALVHLAALASMALFAGLGAFSGVPRLKFLQALDPGDDVRLQLNRSGDRVDFEYRRGELSCASGRLAYCECN